MSTSVRLRAFLRLESAGGILLMAAAAVALAVANLPGVGSLYQGLLDLPMEVKLGGLELKKNFLLLVNDGLMAVFFLLVGLEIKREILEGELSSLGQVALPGIAAVGGVLCPALIYSWINWGDAVALRGWAIPAATDIAFSLGILSLLGPRVPVSLKVFLTAVAVVDDLIAILIIAVFYTAQLSATALALAAVGLVVLVVMNRAGVRSIAAYVWVGVFLWVCVLKSGVHATLAGVALGLAIPLRVSGGGGADKAEKEEGKSGAEEEEADLSAEEEDTDSPRSPLRHLEHTLHPWVAFGVLPLFAFANAGVSFKGLSADVLAGPITLGIAGGLLIGKALGVFGAGWLAIRAGLAKLPEGSGWAGLFGVGLLAGIGFTMSLFIGSLAFEQADPSLGVAVRLGVFAGSIAAAVAGGFVLRATLSSSPNRESSARSGT